MSEILLEALGLGVEIAGKRIVDGVAFAATGGQTVAVLGPNGSGKTTLLRALAGLVPCAGELSVAGLDPRKASPSEYAKKVAYCAQKPSCAWDFQVGDLGEIIGAGPAYADWLAKLDLDGCSDRRLGSLSGGEQKGAHLAMTFASLTEPFGSVLLLDEPAASLDLGRQEAVRNAVRFFARAGAACVVATHDLGFARRCDLVLVLSEGRLVAIGQPGAALTDALIASIWGDSATAG